MAKNNKMPAIRFSGYTDAWEQCKLGEIFEYLQNNTLSRDSLNYKNPNIKNIHYGDILVKFDEILDGSNQEIPYINSELDLSKFSKSLLRDGDIIFSDTAEDDTVGKAIELQNVNAPFILGGLHTIPCRPLIPFGKGYLGNFLNSDSYRLQLRPLIQGIKVSSISKSALKDTMIEYPKNLDEQEKIGSLFYYIAKMITLHQRKLEKLKLTKKALLQKLFPKNGSNIPELRFKGFTNAWEQRKLESLFTKYEDKVNTPSSGYWRLGLRSHCKGTFHTYIDAGNELETAEMNRVKSGNFILNITFAWERALAVTNDEDQDKLVSHRFPQFKPNNDLVIDFFKHTLMDKRFKHHLELSSPGGAGRNKVLKVADMLKYELLVPSIKEQNEISSFLNHVDYIITLHQRKLEMLKNVKKGLLQKMFV